MKERLELVTDFSSLRAGMIVVVKGCNQCGRSMCRGVLVSLIRHAEDVDDGSLHPAVWEAVPNCGPDELPSCISADEVRARRVYRVIDSLEDSTTTRRRAVKPRPLERQAR